MPRPPSPRGLFVGARYQLVRELRTDGETVDWEGFDTALDRAVVVQLLRPDLAHDARAAERFWQTTRAAARQVPTVGAQVLDGGTDPETGQPFVVREQPAMLAAALESPAPGRGRVRLKPRRTGALDASWRWLVLGGVGVALLLAAAVLRPGVEGWLAWVNTSVLPRGERGLVVPPAGAAAADGARAGQNPSTAPATAAASTKSAPPPTLAAPVVTRAPSASPTVTGQARRVVNTDGRGVALRGSAGGDRLPGKGYDEGDTVQALEQSGEWTHIRGPDGREGWVLSVTLAP